jgi:FkbM family methyltransferase
MAVRHLFRESLHRIGWDVRRVEPRKEELAQLVRQLSLHKVDVVFDVGANVGQFAEKLRRAGYSGRIVSFEASTSAHSTLTSRARRDANWMVAPRMALGDREETITLNLARNSVSSSILPMLQSHLNADPKSIYVGTESVDLRTLDSVGTELVSPDERIFLKLDVQGFEFKVLQGARRFLDRVQGIQIELSLVPLYEGERLFRTALNDFEDWGCEMWSLVPGFVDPRTGRLLQLDAVFFRTSMLPSILERSPQ